MEPIEELDEDYDAIMNDPEVQRDQGTARHWLYTVWANELDCSGLADCPDFKYAVWQKERCPETGRLHWHLYVELKRPQRWGRVPQLIGLRVGQWHAAKRRGTRDQARAYCRKERTRVEGPFELGEWTSDRGPGARHDLEAVADAVLVERASVSDVAERFPIQFIKYHRGIVELKQTVRVRRESQKRVVIVLVGPTGTGKTYWVTKTWPQKDRYAPAFQDNKVWFDGYDGEDCLWLDDFDTGHFPFRDVLRICDAEEAHVPKKGGHCYWTGSVVVFTSNREPDVWWPNLNGARAMDPFWRRVTHYREYDESTQQWTTSMLHPDHDDTDLCRMYTDELNILNTRY